MALQVYRLRRFLAATAVLFTMAVAGMYFYARSRVRDVRKEIPNKLGIEIKQTANGFQFSKSDGKRTLFTVQASAVKEFKLNGRAELHNVSIVLYGRDSSRFDQIYGDDFAYDQKTGDVTAQGDVQIDLVANPTGLTSPDQSTPRELKNPIHLKTRDLVFNRDSGNAWTDAPVEFRTPQATGVAVGAKYAGKSNVLTLSSQIRVVLNGPKAEVIEAEHGTVTNDPREIVLERPRLSREGGTLQADEAVFHLGRDNHVERVVATGNVVSETVGEHAKKSSGREDGGSAPGDSGPAGQSELRCRADQAEFLLSGERDLLHTATLSGNVHVEQTGTQPIQGDAGRVVLDFARQNQLQEAHALDGARLAQKAGAGGLPADSAGGQQDFELTAPTIDFMVAQGHVLERAVTSGPAQISITQAQESTVPAARVPPAQRTIVTAGRFEAKFANAEGKNHLAGIHGSPDVRVINSTPGQPDRVSTSESIDAVFLPQGGIDSITQKGNVAYSDGQAPDKRMQAWASSGRYTPADQMLALTGSPRVASGGMTTTGNAIRINRASGDAFADGDVKSTYSELKEQPDGALLASSSPIHVTARSMTAHNSPAVALYTGNARLWQDANIIEAPSIHFDRDRRFVTAQGTAAQPVQTILSRSEKAGSKTAPAPAKKPGNAPQLGGSSSIAITAAELTYADSDRRVHYQGGVLTKGVDFTAAAKTLDAYLLSRSQSLGSQAFAGPGQLDHLVAQGDVSIQQPKRRAEGQKLVYTASDDKFVLTGGPPSIFDAEQGKITGVSLTFFRRDDRVLVEGEAKNPVVTQTRVAR